MNDNKLILSIHFNKGNKGSLVFKKIGDNGSYFSFRINRLCGALGFVGSMKQLVMAVDLGAEQDCAYTLRNDSEKLWVLYCFTRDGRVHFSIDNCGCFKEVFEWTGSVEGFRNAVEGMIAAMGRYAFFA